MEAASLINSAYIKENYNVTVISGINYMPFKFDINSLKEKVV